MPTMANIVLNDATSPSPVAHTFKPISNVNNVGNYADNATGVLSVWQRLLATIRPAAPNNGGHRVTWKLSQPLVSDPVDGECCTPKGTVPPENFVTIEVFRSKSSTNQQINDLLAELKDLVANSQFVATSQGEGLRG
jgi:hypothetical protein